MPRPIIGITCSRSIGGRWSDYSLGHFKEYAFDAYSQAVLGCGGAPLLIPISQNKSSLASVLRVLDGLILSGGPDINPRFYKETPRDGLKDVDDAQDETEVAVACQALAAGLPLFGICRGLQVLNVAMGGTLYQDISRQVPAAINHTPRTDRSVVSHRVRIEPGLRLHAIIKRRTLWVNSNHHQAIRDLAPGLKVGAVAPVGIVEALEDPRQPFVLGVQWHPEGLWHKDRPAKSLFKAFITAAGRRES